MADTITAEPSKHGDVAVSKDIPATSTGTEAPNNALIDPSKHEPEIKQSPQTAVQAVETVAATSQQAQPNPPEEAHPSLDEVYARIMSKKASVDYFVDGLFRNAIFAWT